MEQRIIHITARCEYLQPQQQQHHHHPPPSHPPQDTSTPHVASPSEPTGSSPSVTQTVSWGTGAGPRPSAGSPRPVVLYDEAGAPCGISAEIRMAGVEVSFQVHWGWEFRGVLIAVWLLVLAYIISNAVVAR